MWVSLIYLRFIDDIFFIGTESKEQIVLNLGELNPKHDSLNISTKFQKPVFLFWIQRCISRTTKITPKYIENTLIFLHIDSEHSKSLKDSILYNQALRIKRICAISKHFEHDCKHFEHHCKHFEHHCKHFEHHCKHFEHHYKHFEHHCKECKQRFLEGYNSELLDKHIKAVEKLTRIPLVVTYNRFLPNIISKIIRKN